MWFLVLGWITLYLHFGLTLYLVNPGTLDNPAVSSAYAIGKDCYWILLFLVVFLQALRRRCMVLAPGIIAIGVLDVLFSALYLFVIYRRYGVIDIGYQKLFKNWILYNTAPYIFINLLANLGRLRDFLRVQGKMVAISLTVGIVFHFLSPVKSVSERMFGAYGNPNAVGFVAVVGLSLYPVFAYRQSVLWGYFGSAISIASLALAASLTSIGMFFISFPLLVVSRSYFRVRTVSPKVLFGVGAGLIVMVGAFMYVVSQGDSLIVHRFTNLVAKGDTDSLMEREYRRREALSFDGMEEVLFGRIGGDYRRTDASLIDRFYNFGLSGLFVFVFPSFILWLRILGFKDRRASIDERSTLSFLCAIAVTMFVCSTPIQFQFEVFPTNFLTSSIIASGIVFLKGTGRVS